MAKKKSAKKKTTKKSASKKAKSKSTPKASASKSKTSKKATEKKAPLAPRKRGGPLGIKTQHVDFLTYKVDQLRKFYDDVLELETETRDTEGLNYLLVTTSESSSIGFMPPHPDMLGEQPLPREPTLYFVVKNVDKAYERLVAKGVAFMGGPQEMPWGYRVVTTTDPEGRSIMLASKVGKDSSSNKTGE